MENMANKGYMSSRIQITQLGNDELNLWLSKNQFAVCQQQMRRSACNMHIGVAVDLFFIADPLFAGVCVWYMFLCRTSCTCLFWNRLDDKRSAG